MRTLAKVSAIAGLILVSSFPARPQGTEWETLTREVLQLHRAGQYERAVTVAKKALEVAEKNVGPDHTNVAVSLGNLASLYRAQGRYAQAEPLYKRALTMREKALGADHPDVATSLSNLAELYVAQGQYARAEPLYKRALTIREKALGPDHPDVAASLSSLAELYRAQGQYVKAEPLCKRSLTAREKALGPDHPEWPRFSRTWRRSIARWGVTGKPKPWKSARRVFVPSSGESAMKDAYHRAAGGDFIVTKNMNIIFMVIALFLALLSCDRVDDGTQDNSPDSDADIVMITPFCDTNDVASVNEAFSSTAAAPWGFAHSGIDFFPTTSLKPFRAVAAGTVREFRLWQNGTNWQVNVGIEFNGTYTVGYSFEPFSGVRADGETQLANMRVTMGQKVQQGDTIGYLYVAGGAAHVDFGLIKNNERICPEPYFAPQSREAVLVVIRKTFPGAQMCY